jgi:uncharacterized protein YndB with AHSA1/START domain
MSVVHETITLDRHYPATPERVFRAFADPAAKAQWFRGPEGWDQQGETTFDFREGGRESSAAGVAGGPICTYDATFHDIVPGERIVLSYEMSTQGRRMSVSIQTVELRAEPGGTHLVLTDQGTYLDGLDSAENRASGIDAQLELLAGTLGAAG